MVIIGLDLALRNTGYAVLDRHKNLIQVGTFRTQVKWDKANTPVPGVAGGSLDLIHRSRQLYRDLITLLQWAGTQGEYKLVVEVQHGSQSAPANRALGICCALVGTLEDKFVPLSARQVKEHFTGQKGAEKVDMVEEAVRRYPELRARWENKRTKVLRVSAFEHEADAVAIAVAGFDREELELR